MCGCGERVGEDSPTTPILVYKINTHTNVHTYTPPHILYTQSIHPDPVWELIQLLHLFLDDAVSVHKNTTTPTRRERSHGTADLDSILTTITDAITTRAGYQDLKQQAQSRLALV